MAFDSGRATDGHTRAGVEQRADGLVIHVRRTGRDKDQGLPVEDPAAVRTAAAAQATAASLRL